MPESTKRMDEVLACHYQGRLTHAGTLIGEDRVPEAIQELRTLINNFLAPYVKGNRSHEPC